MRAFKHVTLPRTPTSGSTTDVELFGRWWWRTTSPVSCPICSSGSWCLVRPEEVICMRTSGEKQLRFEDGSVGDWHPLTDEIAEKGFSTHKYIPRDWTWADDTGQVRYSPRDPLPVDVRLAPPAELDRVYRVVLSGLRLDRQHRGQLRKRGQSDDAISRHGYRSLPRYDREMLARKVLHECGLTTLGGIPSFFQKLRSEQPGPWSVAGMSGLLIPYQDEQGRIVFLQVRADDGKYLTLSTPPEKYDNGTKARRIAHIAVPLGVDPLGSKFVWITEGGLEGKCRV